MKRTFRKLLESKPAEGGGAAPVFRITSTNLDRHQDRVLAIKAVGDGFEVPLLWNHDSWNPPIGTAKCKREAGEWVMVPVFDEACDTSKIVAAKVKAGSVRACSIRFRPSPEAEPVPNKEGGYDFPLVEVMEVSMVNIPANQDAVRLRSADAESPEPDESDEWTKYRKEGAAFRAEVRAALAEVKATLAKMAPPEDGKEDEEPKGAEPSAEEEQPATPVEEAEEAAKALRRAVIKGYGMTPADVAAMPLADLAAYAALLPAASR